MIFLINKRRLNKILRQLWEEKKKENSYFNKLKITYIVAEYLERTKGNHLYKFQSL